MRDRTLSHFRHALLFALALPTPALALGCGGSTDTLGTGGPGDGGTQQDAATDARQTPCDWALVSSSSCFWDYSFVGDPAACAGFTQNDTPTAAQCAAVCGATGPFGDPTGSCAVSPSGTSSGGPATWQVDCYPVSGCTLNGGRRTDYFAALGFGAPLRGREVGSHFARTACMEASSVEAFRVLRDELVAHGAPARLVRAARRAIRDEQRHVRQTSALARRFGERPIAPQPMPVRPVRSLAALARDNAVEGCVRETYSALECAWQAERAADPVVRATMKRIARDELRHLALSWAVHAWAMGKLDAASRAGIARAQREGIEDLLAELTADPHESLMGVAGLPQRRASVALVDSIARRAAA
jgi:hypothetical protein